MINSHQSCGVHGPIVLLLIVACCKTLSMISIVVVWEEQCFCWIWRKPLIGWIGSFCFVSWVRRYSVVSVGPLLCVLMAETIACAIHNNLLIDGFSLPGHRTIKLCQYADDTSIFIISNVALTEFFSLFICCKVKQYQVAWSISGLMGCTH